MTQAVRQVRSKDRYRAQPIEKLRPVLSSGHRLQQLAAARGVSLADASRMIGRRAGYLARFVREGAPETLPPLDLRHLSLFFDVEEVELGGDDRRRTPRRDGFSNRRDRGTAIYRLGIMGKNLMVSDHINYFRKRAAQELIIADACSDPAVASIHRRMATEYSLRLKEAAPTLRPMADQ